MKYTERLTSGRGSVSSNDDVGDGKIGRGKVFQLGERFTEMFSL